MIMPPALRKLALTLHVSTSVGWLGAVASFLALAIAGLTNPNPEIVRGAYIGMDVTTWYVIVPLSIASLVTGVVQSLGTVWGLFRHYWVLIKLLLTVVATFLLITHTRPISYVATVATVLPLSSVDLYEVRAQLMFDAGAALLLLLLVTGLSVYKPRGLTRYGWRKQQDEY